MAAQTEKIVITGMGVVTPIGIGAENFWQNLIAGKCGICRVDNFAAEGLPVSVAGVIEDFDPEAYMPRPMALDSPRFSQFAFAAAKEALAQSGLTPNDEPRRVGITMGTALAAVTSVAETENRRVVLGKKKVSPRFVPQMLGNVAVAQIAIENGIQGPCYTVSTACSSGADAMSLGWMLLHSGAADAILAVGADSGQCPIVLSSLSMAKALSRNPDPCTASRPFDLNRDGFVMGEGGSAIILETETHAKARGAKILGVLLGMTNNTDGYHIVAPAPDGRGAVACMEDALHVAGLQPEDIGFVNAHATSTPLGDEIECRAIETVFGAEAMPPISASKGATGHMMGGGGIAQAISCLCAVRDGILPPTLGCETPDPACLGHIITGQAEECRISYAMFNSLGFGGQNACGIVGAY